LGGDDDDNAAAAAAAAADVAVGDNGAADSQAGTPRRCVTGITSAVCFLNMPAMDDEEKAEKGDTGRASNWWWCCRDCEDAAGAS
jgi:hypothetical protein